jgi:hypothetical protein
VLRATLVTKRAEAHSGRILFWVHGQREERVAIELGASIAIASTSDTTADLIVFCDRAQLDAMLETGFTARALADLAPVADRIDAQFWSRGDRKLRYLTAVLERHDVDPRTIPDQAERARACRSYDDLRALELELRTRASSAA